MKVTTQPQTSRTSDCPKHSASFSFLVQRYSLQILSHTQNNLFYGKFEIKKKQTKRHLFQAELKKILCTE